MRTRSSWTRWRVRWPSTRARATARSARPTARSGRRWSITHTSGCDASPDHLGHLLWLLPQPTPGDRQDDVVSELEDAVLASVVFECAPVSMMTPAVELDDEFSVAPQRVDLPALDDHVHLGPW